MVLPRFVIPKGLTADGHLSGHRTVRQDANMAESPGQKMASEPDPRVFFAAERTFLAWIRTGLALMGFGFVVARFGLFLREVATMRGNAAAEAGLSQWFGTGLIALGILLTAASTAAHLTTVRRLNRGEPFVGRPTWLGVSIAVLLVALGVVMMIYLLWAS
jgi:putative membrane protein